ncbi:hypothetical protein PFISCL1PPCAC_22561, partial [Pristionchus fissidentatus]
QPYLLDLTERHVDSTVLPSEADSDDHFDDVIKDESMNESTVEHDDVINVQSMDEGTAEFDELANVAGESDSEDTVDPSDHIDCMDSSGEDESDNEEDEMEEEESDDEFTTMDESKSGKGSNTKMIGPKQDLVCRLCKGYRTPNVSTFTQHLRRSHKTTAKELEIAFRCDCGNEALSAGHRFKSQHRPVCLRGYMSHLKSRHGTTLKESGIYLRCSCGTKITS